MEAILADRDQLDEILSSDEYREWVREDLERAEAEEYRQSEWLSRYGNGDPA